MAADVRLLRLVRYESAGAVAYLVPNHPLVRDTSDGKMVAAEWLEIEKENRRVKN